MEVHGSGRTDAGVHAYGQTANAKLETEKSAEEIKEYVNAYLPKDIAVVDAREVSMRFHSRLLAVSKTYRYRIRTGKDREVFSRNFVWHLGKPLDLSAMRMAAEKLVGTHDFLPWERKCISPSPVMAFCITWCGFWQERWQKSGWESGPRRRFRKSSTPGTEKKRVRWHRPRGWL